MRLDIAGNVFAGGILISAFASEPNNMAALRNDRRRIRSAFWKIPVKYFAAKALVSPISKIAVVAPARDTLFIVLILFDIEPNDAKCEVWLVASQEADRNRNAHQVRLEAGVLARRVGLKEAL